MKEFLDSLLQGDPRAFVLLAIGIAAFIIMRNLVRTILKKFGSNLNVIAVVIISLIVFSYLYYPQRTEQKFYEATKWVGDKIDQIWNAEIKV